ncbi:hypothetical protein LMG8520_2428 [Lactococcus lactis subsp. lactis]|uniref:Uncharacterized protein n=1 Tax=Lactococcus lactis subsp. lactis TaxID=1360 RepID=A0A0V8CWI0_LACLL|nr:hypothetical protein LMG8520_2428 [Lactococcus lactis subsp. lactis]
MTNICIHLIIIPALFSLTKVSLFVLNRNSNKSIKISCQQKSKKLLTEFFSQKNKQLNNLSVKSTSLSVLL